MKFYFFMKYYSLAMLCASVGCAAVCAVSRDWLTAIYCVVLCAANHACYNMWGRRLKESKK